jgi:hypothetical protein
VVIAVAVDDWQCGSGWVAVVRVAGGKKWRGLDDY